MAKRNYDVRVLESGLSVLPPYGDFSDVDQVSGAGVPNPFRDNDTVQRWPLGTLLIEGALRRWAYARAGAVNLAPGKAVQSVVPTSGHENMATAVAAADAVAISATPTSTNLLVDEYNGGILLVNDVDGEGQMRRIKDVPAITADAEGVITLVEDDGIITALTANSQTTVVRNPFADVIIHPSPNTARIVGVPQTPITATRYGWVCITGEAAVLTDGTLVIAKGTRASDAEDGAVETLVRAGTAEDEQSLGICTQVNATAEYSVVHLDL